jgi:hypothetical protein
MILKMKFNFSLTPALSHPMGEGESFAAFLECGESGFAKGLFANKKTADFFSLSRRTGEGQGEGNLK